MPLRIVLSVFKSNIQFPGVSLGFGYTYISSNNIPNFNPKGFLDVEKCLFPMSMSFIWRC